MSTTDMLADAVVSFAEMTRDRRVNEGLLNERAAKTIRVTPVSKNGCYGVKITAHPSLRAEVTFLLDAVTRMSGHPESGPVMRTDAAILYRWA